MPKDSETHRVEFYERSPTCIKVPQSMTRLGEKKDTLMTTTSAYPSTTVPGSAWMPLDGLIQDWGAFCAEQASTAPALHAVGMAFCAPARETTARSYYTTAWHASQDGDLTENVACENSAIKQARKLTCKPFGEMKYHDPPRDNHHYRAHQHLYYILLRIARSSGIIGRASAGQWETVYHLWNQRLLHNLHAPSIVQCTALLLFTAYASD